MGVVVFALGAILVVLAVYVRTNPAPLQAQLQTESWARMSAMHGWRFRIHEHGEEVTGSLAGFPLALTWNPGDADWLRPSVTDLTVQLSTLPNDFTIRRRRPTDLGGLGDPRFDEQVYIDGPLAAVLAALNAKRRLKLTVLVKELDLHLTGGTLHFRYRGRLPAGVVDEITHFLEQLLSALNGGVDQPAALCVRVRDELLPGVRRAALGQLIANHPGHPSLAEAVAQALDDDDPELRVQALGTSERFADLEHVLAGDDVPQSARLLALSYLVSSPASDRRRVLTTALRHADRRFVCAVVEQYGRQDDLESILLDLVKTAPPQVLVTVCRLWEAQINPQRAPDLEQLLHHKSRDVALAAVQALAALGGRDCIPALKQVRGRFAMFRLPTEQAVRRIESRWPEC